MKKSNKVYFFLPVTLVVIYVGSFLLLSVDLLNFQFTKSGFQMFLRSIYGIIALVTVFLLYKREYKNVLLWGGGCLVAHIIIFVTFLLVLGWGLDL